MKTSSSNSSAFWPIMFAIFFGNFLAILSTNTVTVALPVLMDHFHTDLSAVQWTLAGFMLATGTVAPIVGYLGDRFTYKKLYLFALIGFTLVSGLCAMAWDIRSLIVFRVLQGIFSGLIMPTTMTIVYQVIPREKQAFALSIWSLSMMLAPAFGPTLAGWLIHMFSWKWLFLMNLPIGAAGVIAVILFIPKYRLTSTKSLDLPGFIAVILGSLSLLIAFSEGGVWGWTSWTTISLIFAGLVILAWFVRRELTTPDPLLNLRVFKYSRYTISIALNCIITISLYSGTFLAPVFLQTIQQASALTTGLILLPSSLTMAIFMPITGKLYERLGPFKLIFAGLVLIGIGTWEMSRMSIDTSHGYITFWMAVRNVGIALSSMPTLNAGMEVIPRDWTGHASSINNWLRQGLGSFSIGLFTSILGIRTASHLADLKASAPGTTAADWEQQAFTLGVNDVFTIATVIALIGLPCTFLLLRKGKKTAEAATEPS